MSNALDSIVSDPPCVNCNYNLRGLQPDGLCPECGKPIATSLAPRLLDAAGSKWCVRFGVGLWMLIAAMVVGIVSVARGSSDVVIAFLASGIGPSRAFVTWIQWPWTRGLANLLLLATSLVLNAVGCTLISIRGPRQYVSETGAAPTMLRWASIIAGMFGLLSMAWIGLAGHDDLLARSVLTFLPLLDVWIVLPLYILLARRAREARGPRVLAACFVAAFAHVAGSVLLCILLLHPPREGWLEDYGVPLLFCPASVLGTWVAWDFQFKIRDAQRRRKSVARLTVA